MGTISVAINRKHLFDWEGNAAELEKIEPEIAPIAEQQGTNPEAFAQHVIQDIAKRGDFALPLQQGEMVWLMYFVTQTRLTHPDHPGYCRDYIELWNFNFDIQCDEQAKTLHADVHATLCDIAKA
jgi:hypothetical protein